MYEIYEIDCSIDIMVIFVDPISCKRKNTNPIIIFFAVVTEKYWPAVIRNAPSLRGYYVLTKG